MNNLLNDSDSKRVADATIDLIEVLKEKIPRYIHNAAGDAIELALNGVASDGSGQAKRDLGARILDKIYEATLRAGSNAVDRFSPEQFGQIAINKIGYTIEECLHSKEYHDSIEAAIERGTREGIENRQC